VTPPQAGGRDSRVLVLSQRNLSKGKELTTQYELEDLLGELDDVSVLAPGPARHADTGMMARRLVNGGLLRAGLPRRSPPWTRPSMRPTRVVGEHDLFFMVVGQASQLAYLHRLQGWRERSRYAVCFLLEVWTHQVAENADYYRLLREFDAVYMLTPQAGPALQALGAPTPGFLPTGVDARAADPLHPRGVAPVRGIDVYAYGRTSPALHRQLLELVDTAGLSYQYDTMFEGKVFHPVEHRALLANSLKRARYHLAHRINDAPQRLQRTGGEESLSTRYFEASASGAVLLGSRPRTPDFDACFDWPDAVIDVPWDCDDLAGVLRDLAGQPDRLAAARAAGVRAALLRHDWAYRWERVLTDAGLSVPAQVRARQARLQEQALAVTSDSLTPRVAA
jgi:hypothetical protein